MTNPQKWLAFQLALCILSGFAWSALVDILIPRGPLNITITLLGILPISIAVATIHPRT